MIKFTGVLLLTLLISVFIWANWEAPSPGMRASVVDFVQYDVSSVKSERKLEKSIALLRKQPGVNGVTYNPNSNLLVVAYAIDQTERFSFESTIRAKMHIAMREKVFEKSGPQCPINVAYISKVKKFFCVRD